MCESGLIDGEVRYAPEPLDRPADGNVLHLLFDSAVCDLNSIF